MSQTLTCESLRAPRLSWRRRVRRLPSSVVEYWTVLFRNAGYLAAQSLRELIRIPLVIALVCLVRYWFFARVLRRTRLFQAGTSTSDAVAPNTVAHNLKGLRLNAWRAFSGERPHQLLQIIGNIEGPDRANSKLLFVGPRAESELLLARSYGFRKQNVRGLDLISYSPHVDLGDMHHMPYPDDSWDLVVLGWVLAYSESPQAACREVLRVARSGAVVAIGAQYHPLSPEQIAQSIGYYPGAKTRLNSTAEILALFGDQVDQIFFRHDVHPSRADQPGSILVVFSVKKTDA